MHSLCQHTNNAGASLIPKLLQRLVARHAKAVPTHQLWFVAQHVNASLD
jgi:hypothetical protein